MTLREFIKKLQLIKEELQDKEVVVIAPNGLRVNPSIKFSLKDEYNLYDKSKDNVKAIVMSWD